LLLTSLLRLAVSLTLQVRAFKEDPLIFHGDLRVATGNELLRVSQARHSKFINRSLQDSSISVLACMSVAAKCSRRICIGPLPRFMQYCHV
jgi:hypothetical protein